MQFLRLKSFGIFVILVYNICIAFAQEEIAPIIQSAAYQKHQLMSIPTNINTGQGKTYIVEKQTHSILYVIDKCFVEETILSSDANTLVEILNPVEKRTFSKPCMNLYQKGILAEQYLLSDIGLDTFKLKNEKNLTGWAFHQLYFPVYTLGDTLERMAYNAMQNKTPFISQDTLFFVSADRVLYGISTLSGNTILKTQAPYFFKQYGFPKNYTKPVRRYVSYPLTNTIVTPSQYGFLERSLYRAIRKKAVKKRVKARLYVYLWIEIDNMGKPSVVWQDVKRVRRGQLLVSEKLNDRVNKWFSEQLVSLLADKKNELITIYCIGK